MIYFTIWVIFGFIGALVGCLHQRPGFGLIMGLLLGPIGWILALFNVRGATVFLVLITTNAIAVLVVWMAERDKDAAFQSNLREQGAAFDREMDRQRFRTPQAEPAPVDPAPDLAPLIGIAKSTPNPAVERQRAAAAKEEAARQERLREIQRKYGTR